jgi:hypothetical protein
MLRKWQRLPLALLELQMPYVPARKTLKRIDVVLAQDPERIDAQRTYATLAYQHAESRRCNAEARGGLTDA